MKKILSTLAAVMLSGAIAAAAYLPPVIAPFDPGSYIALANTMFSLITSGVNGEIANGSGAISSAATTAAQTLASTSRPGGTLNRAGQALRLRCAGMLANTSHTTNTISLTFGSQSITTAAATTSGQGYDLELVVMDGGTQPSTITSGRGTVGTVVVSPTSSTSVTDDLTAAQTAKCTTTQGTASAADVVNYLFYIEQIK